MVYCLLGYSSVAFLSHILICSFCLIEKWCGSFQNRGASMSDTSPSRIAFLLLSFLVCLSGVEPIMQVCSVGSQKYRFLEISPVPSRVASGIEAIRQTCNVILQNIRFFFHLSNVGRVGSCRVFGLFWAICRINNRSKFQCFTFYDGL
jgi:hypothetical protein